jgi:hypothetical protein
MTGKEIPNIPEDAVDRRSTHAKEGLFGAIKLNLRQNFLM